MKISHETGIMNLAVPDSMTEELWQPRMRRESQRSAAASSWSVYMAVNLVLLLG